MEDKRGEFYSNGYCTASNTDCKNNQEGACGICQIGGAYRNRISQLESLEEPILKIISRNL